MSAPDWPLGHIVGRRYTVQQVLGRTPFTRTYAALTEPNKEVVLRVYGAESNEAIDEMMESLPDYTNFPEAGILRVLEIGSDAASGARFVVTERSRHPSLASMVELCPLAINEATAFAQRLANAIDVAHDRKLLHLGIKPSNVFVGTMPSGGVDVSDFGAPRVGPISFEQARWQAPEQIAEHQPAASADVFSFALVVFYAMTGKSYWRASGVEELAGELSAPRVAASARAKELGVTLPKEMDVAFAAALASDPAKRPARAADFAGALVGKPLVIPTRTSIPPRPLAKTPSVAPPRPVAAPVIDDIPPPPEELLARVAPVLAPQPVMMIGDAPAARPEPAPAPPAPAPPPAPMAWKDEAPTDPVQTPVFDAPPPPPPQPEPPAVFPAPPVVDAPRTSAVVRQRRVMTVALSAVAGMLFLLAGIIMIVALKKPKHDAAQATSASVVKSAAPPVASLAIVDPPPIATSVAAVASSAPSDSSSAPPIATTDTPTTAPTTDDSTPTLALGPHDSELLVVCEPQPCSLVMVDRKKMKEYPGPTIVPPGAHGVGIDADGCWGGWKLVTTKAGERTTVTFTLNKRPPGVANPLGKKKQPLPF